MKKPNVTMFVGATAFLAVVILLASPAGAASIAISGYDVFDASVSGSGGWAHTYSGTITPTSGGLADYSGGTGTMANGVVETSTSATQLFHPSTVNEQILLYLGGLYRIDRIDIYGGDFGASNSVPGSITGLDVTLGGSTQSFATAQFGPVGNSGQGVNDRVTITGSALDGFATDTILLDGVISSWGGGTFSIAEIEVFGTPIPEPGSLAMVGLGLFGMAMLWRRRRT